jgi:phosphoglycolate phosphatase
MSRRAFIFDLDGTLVDSRRDLATAVNGMRAHYGLPPLDLSTVTGYVGDGVRMLVTRALAGTAINVEEALKIQQASYRAHRLDETVPYPGVVEGLRALHAAGHCLGVATNKPADACDAILRHFGMFELFCEVLGGGSTPNLKPHPEMILRIIARCGLTPADAWVVGDHHTDLEAARRAGARSIFCRYGIGTPGAETPTLAVDRFDEITRRFAP